MLEQGRILCLRVHGSYEIIETPRLKVADLQRHDAGLLTESDICIIRAKPCPMMVRTEINILIRMLLKL